MMRIRSVQPNQWTQESFVQCSPLARLLALALRNEADDNGIFPWKPFQLKLRLLPGDDCDIEALLDELVQSGQVWRFTVGEAVYGAVRDWRSHQRPQRPSYVHPTPEEPWPAGFHFHPAAVEAESGPFLGAPRPIHDRSAPEPKGEPGEKAERNLPTEAEEERVGQAKREPVAEGSQKGHRSARSAKKQASASGSANRGTPSAPRSRPGGASSAQSVGRVAGTVFSGGDWPDATGELARRLLAVTGDPAGYEAWWRTVIERMEATDGMSVLFEAQRYASRCADPAQRKAKDLGELKHPGGYVAAKCRDWLHRHGKRLPPPPQSVLA